MSLEEKTELFNTKGSKNGDGTDGQEPRKMNMAERLERFKGMKESLRGISFDAHIEPSHALTDKVMAMIEAVSYIELSACTSRESTAAKERGHKQQFDTDSLKRSKQEHESRMTFRVNGSLLLGPASPEADRAWDEVAKGDENARLRIPSQPAALQVDQVECAT